MKGASLGSKHAPPPSRSSRPFPPVLANPTSLAKTASRPSNFGRPLLIQRQTVKAERERLNILEPRHYFVDYYANSIGHLLLAAPATIQRR